MSSVYLAGKISGISNEDAVDWREYAKRFLNHAGIDVRSPMRGKEFLKGITFTHDMYHIHPIASTSGVLARDRYDVEHCDIALFNFAVYPTIGRQTIIEIGWADMLRKPIIFIDPIGLAPPLFQEMAGFQVDNLDQGLDICKAILTL